MPAGMIFMAAGEVGMGTGMGLCRWGGLGGRPPWGMPRARACVCAGGGGPCAACIPADCKEGPTSASVALPPFFPPPPPPRAPPSMCHHCSDNRGHHPGEGTIVAACRLAPEGEGWGAALAHGTCVCTCVCACMCAGRQAGRQQAQLNRPNGPGAAIGPARRMCATHACSAVIYLWYTLWYCAAPLPAGHTAIQA